MRNVKKLFGIGAALAVVGLSGCAPGMVGPVSFRFNSCSPIQRQAQSHFNSSFYASRQRIAAAQARFSTAGPARRANGIVSGECRY
ncbi:MAG TPA: hypothetical protein VF746_16240 [Longimicrobium sp.]|jgi:hypothetical protein